MSFPRRRVRTFCAEVADGGLGESASLKERVMSSGFMNTHGAARGKRCDLAVHGTVVGTSTR